jgi:hypothetical protein
VLWVWLHLIVAGLLLAGIVWLTVWVRRQASTPPVGRRAAWLLGLFSLQLLLGLATWVTNYGYPAWFTNYLLALEYTVVAEGRLQAVTTTAHVGVGSLALVTALTLTLWLFRFSSPRTAAARSSRTR